MTKLLGLFLSLSLAAFAGDEDRVVNFAGLGLPHSVQQQLVDRYGTSREAEKARASRPGVAAALRAPEAQGDGHYVSCSTADTGMGHALRVSKEGAMNNKKAKWSVALETQQSIQVAGEDSVVRLNYAQVEDAKLKVLKTPLLFETQQKHSGGFISHNLKVETYVVKASVTSATTDLGEQFMGCMPHKVKTVEVTLVCFDTTSVGDAPK